MAASRRPALFGAGGFPDTLEGRFEAMTLNGGLALMRLQKEPGLATLAQVFTDALFSHFDAGLREAGVGDTTVPKRMRAMAGSFYGRLDAYSRAVAEGGLEDALQRNAGLAADFAARLAVHVRQTAERQSAAPVEDLMSAAGWPVFGG